MAAYEQAFRAWEQNPLDESLQNNLRRAAMPVDLFTETQQTIESTVGTRVEDRNWKDYQAAQDAYKADPTYNNEMAVVNAATRVGGEAASNARQLLSDIDSRRTASELRALENRRWARFEETRDAYLDSPTLSNYNEMVTAALPLGAMDELNEYVSHLTTQEQIADVQRGMSILAPLSAGRTDEALEVVNALIEGAADPQEAQQLSMIRDLIEAGDIGEAQRQMHMTLGAYDQGREILDTMTKYDQERRAEDVTAAQLLEMTMDLEFDNEEQLANFREAVDGLPYGLAEALSEFARVAVPDAAQRGAARDSMLDREENLRKEYEGYIKPHMTVISRFEGIEAIYDLDNPTGMADQALITLYNKVLDPESVVRQSEFANTAAAQAILDRLDTQVRGAFDEGQSLGDDAKAAIVQASRELAELARSERARYRDLIQNTIDVIDPEGLYGSAERVFRDTAEDENTGAALRARVEDIVALNPEYGEQIRRAIRNAGITSVQELNNFVAGSKYEMALQQMEDRRSEEASRRAAAEKDSGVWSMGGN